MVTNNIRILIDDKDYTANLVLPVKIGNLLDERLDEGSVTLRAVKRDIFKPFTEAKIVVKNTISVRSSTRTYTKEYPFIIANDTATEMPIGSGLYNHDIYLIERTKILETIVVESLTFRNSLKLRAVTEAPPTLPSFYGASIDYGVNFANTFAVYNAGEITLPSAWDLLKVTDYVLSQYSGTKRIEVDVKNSSNVSVYNYDVEQSTIADITPYLQATHSFSISTGSYSVTYRIYNHQGGSYQTIYGVDFGFEVFDNAYPLKRITCKDVVDRLLSVCEPIRLGDTPRFSLASGQADWLDSLYAPEFSFTRSTLRECLQQVGHILHAEPRLVGNNIYFDKYGGNELSEISKNKYVGKTSSITSEQYCTELDSSVSNIISASDWVKGVVVEPQEYRFKSVRTETINIRIEDTNMIISTERPIYVVSKLEAIWNDNGAVQTYDITPYVFERNTYETRLSSYEGHYPYAKCYAVYYTQGQKDIKGLNFKAQTVSAFSVFQNYAIVNILNAVSYGEISTSWLEADYPTKLAFRVTYVPFYETRVKTSKPLLTNEPTITLVYNQSANMVDSRAYGENLKGAVARLGNVEKSYNYNLVDIRSIPKAGELFSKDYYISNVNIEFLPSFTRLTIGLSKDFNRLSQYIGINSERRYSEISEKNTYDRAWVKKQIIEVGHEKTGSSSTILRTGFLSSALSVFHQATLGEKIITHAIAYGGTYWYPTGQAQAEMTIVDLPVVATAIGTALVFIWAYADNYSAGSKSSAVDITDSWGASVIKGQFNEMVGYTDKYGKMYYYNFCLKYSETATNYTNTMNYAYSTPDLGTDKSVFTSNLISTEDRPFVYRKDSAEIPQFNLEVEFVSNKESIVVGTGIAENNPLVRGLDYNRRAKLYPLPYIPNKFVTNLTELDLTGVTPISIIASNLSMETNYRAVLTIDDVPAHKGWVIASQLTTTTETVIDDKGQVLEQTIYEGGQVLLIGTSTFAPVYFSVKGD